MDSVKPDLFNDVAFELPINGISEPVEIVGIYYIIKLNNRKDDYNFIKDETIEYLRIVIMSKRWMAI